MAAIAAYLEVLLDGTDLTQEDLAKRMGVSQTLVSDAKNQRKASDTTLEKLAAAMGISPPAILDGSALEDLRRRRAVDAAAGPSPVARSYEPEPGQARTTDQLFWRDFASRAGNEAFDEIVEATRARAARDGWSTDLDAVLNIAAKAVGRNYAGRPPTHAEARAAVARGVAIVVEGRDPDDEPQLAPKVPERAAPTPAAPGPKLTMKEKAAALAAKKGGRRG